MHKLVYLFILLIFLVALYVLVPRGQSQAETLEDGLILASQQDKLVFLYINSSWCGYCSVIEKEFAESREFQEIIDAHYIWVTLDFDRNPSVVRKYGLQGTPVMIILDQNGTPLTGIPGYPPNGVLDVIAMLKEALK